MLNNLTTPHDYPGKLFVVEGIDGSGKTTQLALLAKWLSAAGHSVLLTEWNSSALVKAATKTGKKKNSLTPMTFSLLHATDFADRLLYNIVPPLKAGMLGYYPEGVPYGPQVNKTDIFCAVLQFGGASGSGYLLPREVKAGMEELKKFGEFKDGIFHRNDDVAGRVRIDPHRVMVAVNDLIGICLEGLAAVDRHVQTDATHQETSGILRIDANLTEVHRARIHAAHLPPRRAAVVGAIDAGGRGSFLRRRTATSSSAAARTFDERIDDIRVVAIDVESDSAE